MGIVAAGTRFEVCSRTCRRHGKGKHAEFNTVSYMCIYVCVYVFAFYVHLFAP